MNQADAKVLVAIKWQHTVDNEGNPGDMFIDHPELRELINGNAYCELYIASQKGRFKSCFKCPIRVKSNKYKTSRVGCEQNTHPWYLWNRSKTTANAQAMLDLVDAS